MAASDGNYGGGNIRNAEANTGSGGGASDRPNGAGSGGSGIVIIAYPT